MVLHPPPREQRRTPSTAIAPPSGSPTPPNRHRGSSTVHPRRRFHPVATPQAGATVTQGTPARTLGRNQPTGSCPQQRQPPPRAQSHAPSMPIIPPTATPNRANHHRGSTASRPRTQLARPQHPQAEATTAQGATPYTLDPNHPAHSYPKHMQPPPKEHHGAPSTAITPLKAVPNKGNRHRGRTNTHPRREPPRPQRSRTGPTAAEGASQCTLGAVSPNHDPPGRSNHRPRCNPMHPRRS